MRYLTNLFIRRDKLPLITRPIIDFCIGQRDENGKQTNIASSYLQIGALIHTFLWLLFFEVLMVFVTA
jgi:hypothetical protein